MNTSFSFTRIPRAFLLTVFSLLGLAPTAPADDNNGQGNRIASLSWQSVPGYIVDIGHNIVNRGNRVIEPNNNNQYHEPRARYADQQFLRNNSMEVAVQQALARNGYYRGPIDGNIGPMSRRAIANYQADRGMRVTGYPDDSLLNSLGLQ